MQLFSRTLDGMAETEPVRPSPICPSPNCPSFDDPLIEAFGMLVETHNELTNAVTRQLAADAALPVPWIGVLIRLARSPGHRLRMSELARDMTMSSSGLTRLADRLEAAGHVQRVACPADRRGLHAELTADGMATIEKVAPLHVADLGKLLQGPLSDRQLAQLTDLLRRVRDHVRATAG